MIFASTVTIMARSYMTVGDFDKWAEVTRPKKGEPFYDMRRALDTGRYTLDHIVEFAGRCCYRSWDKGREHHLYIRNILEQRHGSVLEHAYITFAIAGVSRSLTHELVRHRAGFAYSQESQRYVDAMDVQFVVPPGLPSECLSAFEAQCEGAREAYGVLQPQVIGSRKEQNQTARSVLPNAAETRIVVTANLRALRHFFEMRGSVHADTEIRQLAIRMFSHASTLAPHCFGDIVIAEELVPQSGGRKVNVLQVEFSKI